jgi:Tfp pilus assembly protein PilZ
MADNFDDRIARRISFITPLQVTDLTSGEIYQAKMLDYSEGGISFASDGFFKKGSPLYFAILYPPDYTTSRIIEYYKGKVMWRKDSQQPSLSFEYGVQLTAESGLKDSNTNDGAPAKDLRCHPRRVFSRPLRFDVEEKVYDGSTKNISASGIFIATDQKMEIGQLINLNLPLKKGKMVRAQGEIIWVNNEGFGLKFIKEK